MDINKGDLVFIEHRKHKAWYNVEYVENGNVYYKLRIKYPTGIKSEIWCQKLIYITKIKRDGVIVWQEDIKHEMERKEEEMKVQITCDENNYVKKQNARLSGKKIYHERRLIEDGYTSYEAKNIVNHELGDIQEQYVKDYDTI